MVLGNQKPRCVEKAIFDTERCRVENYLSLPNCVDECSAGCGERSANRFIGEGKAFQLRKELSCNDNEQEYARAQVAVRKEARSRLVRRWQERWRGENTGRWTHRLIQDLSYWLEKKHGEVGFYLTQALTGHGCFNAYLTRFKIGNEEACDYWGSSLDDAEHTLFARGEWSVAREAASRSVGAELTPDMMVPLMLKSEECWQHVESFVTQVMRTKDLDGRSRGVRNR